MKKKKPKRFPYITGKDLGMGAPDRGGEDLEKMLKPEKRKKKGK